MIDLTHQQIIALAEQVGLLVEDEDYPYTVRAHQRKIDKLKNFLVEYEQLKEKEKEIE